MSSVQAAIQAIGACLALTGGTLFAEEMRLVSWNLESGGITRSRIGAELQSFEGVQLWTLSEVQAANADFFIASAGEGEPGEFAGVIGSTGGNDRLLVIYDRSRLDELDAFELGDLALGGRAPLVLDFSIRDGGQEFLLVAVHLHRRDAEKRFRQAAGLREWAASQSLPVIIAGDFNFDYEAPDGPGNGAFDECLLGHVLKWERPAELVATQYSDANGDGRNDHESVLDFVLSAGGAQAWSIDTTILVREGDFPDDGRTSDHRPLVATIDPVADAAEAFRAEPILRVARPRESIGHASLEERTTFGARPAAGARLSGELESRGRDDGFGRFEGRVVAEWNGNGREMTLLEDFHYVDAHARRWTAPTGAEIDGASIPRAFWSVIGGPFEGQFRNASVVHDAYCDHPRGQAWQDVHRMFYEACRCGGVGLVKAKTMYYAVYHFGPRWSTDGDAAPPLAAATRPSDIDPDRVNELKAYVRLQNPSLSELENLSPALVFGQEENDE